MLPIPELEAIRKVQILEAGFKVLAQKGSANVTMDDVCKEAGLSKGWLVYYYKNKRMLFGAVFEGVFSAMGVTGVAQSISML
jgi:AcrR family transcriptional regulator